MVVAEGESERMRSKGTEQLFVHSFSQPVLTEHLLCAGYYSRPRRIQSEQKDKIPCPCVYSLEMEGGSQRNIINKYII